MDAPEVLDATCAPEGNGAIMTRYNDVFDRIPAAAEGKARYLKTLETDATTAANVQALCVYFAKVYNFDGRRKDFISWAREALKIEDEPNIENMAATGRMLNSFKADAEFFALLMEISYRKNIALAGIADRTGFKKFVLDRKEIILNGSREALLYEKKRVFYPETVTDDAPDKPEQMTFDFSGLAEIGGVMAKCADPAPVFKKIMRKLRANTLPDMLHGSLTVSAAAVTYWREHPETRPENLAEYAAAIAEINHEINRILTETAAEK